MSNPIMTKVEELIVQGPPNTASAMTRVEQFIIVDTTKADVAASQRKRVQGSIRYGRNS